MNITTKNEIIELLGEDRKTFDQAVSEKALETRKKKANILHSCAMLGYSNFCKSRCLYCGMSALCKIERYRISADDVMSTADMAYNSGFRRLFLISGEDPCYNFEDLLKITSHAKKKGFHISLACGEYEKTQYRELKSAGCDCYVVKFEMSDPEVFNRLNPSTNFTRRMKTIEYVKQAGLQLGSGNIVDYPGQTVESLADDILLMKELEIDWAPVIPYMPAAGTPLAAEGGRGSLDLTLREISILRIMMPEIIITAQQPGENPKDGLGGEQGNLAALKAGANILFADLLPTAKAKAFRVVDDRRIAGYDHIKKMADLSGMETDLAEQKGQV